MGNELEETEGGLCADNEDSEHLKRPFFIYVCVSIGLRPSGADFAKADTGKKAAREEPLGKPSSS